MKKRKYQMAWLRYPWMGSTLTTLRGQRCT